MNKKVLQFETRAGWNRITGDDINEFMREFFPAWPDGHLRQAVRYLMNRGRDLGVAVRFNRLRKCREESYKPFTSTEKYFRTVEEETFSGFYGGI